MEARLSGGAWQWLLVLPDGVRTKMSRRRYHRCSYLVRMRITYTLLHHFYFLKNINSPFTLFGEPHDITLHCRNEMNPFKILNTLHFGNRSTLHWEKKQLFSTNESLSNLCLTPPSQYLWNSLPFIVTNNQSWAETWFSNFPALEPKITKLPIHHEKGKIDTIL